MKEDCIGYESTYCSILKKLYCKNEECKFYKKGNKKKIEIKEAELKIDEPEGTKAIKKEHYKSQYYYKKQTKCKINYINYGTLEFSDEEIEKLKNKQLKIR